LGGGEYCKCIIMCKLYYIISGGDKKCLDGMDLDFY
jgi:hypothetical protein